MNSQILQKELFSLKERTDKVRQKFQNASQDAKSGIFDLIPGTKISEGTTNVQGFCDWGK